MLHHSNQFLGLRLLPITCNFHLLSGMSASLTSLHPSWGTIHQKNVFSDIIWLKDRSSHTWYTGTRGQKETWTSNGRHGLNFLIQSVLTAVQIKNVQLKSRSVQLDQSFVVSTLKNTEDLLWCELCFNKLHHISSLMAVYTTKQDIAWHAHVTEVKFMMCQLLRKGALRQA